MGYWCSCTGFPHTRHLSSSQGGTPAALTDETTHGSRSMVMPELFKLQSHHVPPGEALHCSVPCWVTLHPPTSHSLLTALLPWSPPSSSGKTSCFLPQGLAWTRFSFCPESFSCGIHCWSQLTQRNDTLAGSPVIPRYIDTSDTSYSVSPLNQGPEPGALASRLKSSP